MPRSRRDRGGGPILNLSANELQQLILADALRLEEALRNRLQPFLDNRTEVTEDALREVVGVTQDFFKNGMLALSGSDLPPMSVRAYGRADGGVQLMFILHTNHEDQEVGFVDLVTIIYEKALVG